MKYLSEFQNFWKNNKILSLCLLITFVFFFHNALVVSKTYSSTSIIAIKDNNQGLNASSLFSLISVPPAALQQLQEFLESEEASNILQSEFNVKEAFTSNDIDIFSKFNSFGISEILFNQSLSRYIQNKLTVTINREANTIEITTMAFSPAVAKRLNLALISIANYYFTRKKNISAQITKINQECEYLLSKSNINEVSLDSFTNKSLQEADTVETANELLLAHAASMAERCKDLVNSLPRGGSVNKPVFVDNLSVENARASLRSIFRNSVDLLTNSDNLVIVSEPQTPELHDDKGIMLKSLILFVTLVLSFFSLETLRKILFDFK
tara:strand:+ start:11741 stop:12715 length:975 start_codon:yes stop_codon:yes gene_type:complete